MYSINYNGINILVDRYSKTVTNVGNINRYFNINLPENCTIDDMRTSPYYRIPAFRSFVTKISSMIEKYNEQQMRTEIENEKKKELENERRRLQLEQAEKERMYMSQPKEVIKYVPTPTIDKQAVGSIYSSLKHVTIIFIIVIVLVVIMFIVNNADAIKNGPLSKPPELLNTW